MSKASIFTLGIVTSFCLGFAVNTIIVKQHKLNTTKMKKVTGIGGIFFKCKDPNAVKEWYNKHLGLDAGPYGASFEWRQLDAPEKKGLTQWNVNTEAAKMYDPSTKDFMINYRVDDLEALVAQLKTEGVTIVDSIEDSDYGKFVHIIDLEGNKVQLWEPKDGE